jgi:hypothetical protein
MPTDVSDADVLSEYDPKDPSAIPEETRRKAKEVADSALPRKGSLKGVRIGVPRVSSPPPPSSGAPAFSFFPSRYSTLS